MALQAYLIEQSPDLDRRSSPRRTLRLTTVASGQDGALLDVLIHEVSREGLLLEAPGELAEGEIFSVEIPSGQLLEAKVVWRRKRMHGCRFSQPLTKAALSSMVLRSDADPAPVQFEAQGLTDALLELHALEDRVGRLKAVVNARMDELAPSAVPPEAVREAFHHSMEEHGDKLPFATRARVLVVLAMISWGLIFLAAAQF